jgi:serine/threonine protein kinase
MSLSSDEKNAHRALEKAGVRRLNRDPPGPLVEQHPTAVAMIRAGNIIDGKYRVERVLGQGGMGVVVAARHVRLGERVAIKFPLARLVVRADVNARLIREGRAAMRIRSEHVARVHDVGTLENGEPYLVMEYLEGHDLDAVIAADGPLPIDAAIEYVLQASEALAEAHSLGIIHRDLKPSNLFLSRRADGSPAVKVIDFGVAKHLGDADGAGAAFTTAANAVLGSPLYMSPEQMRAAPTIDARTDIWAIGATLHCLLTGAAPFPGASIPEIHELILSGAPPLRASRPDAPAALEAILLRCLRRDPAERYPSIAALAGALAEIAPEHARISAERAARIFLTSSPAFTAPTDDDAAVGVTTNVALESTDDARSLVERRTHEGALLTTEPFAEVSWSDAAPQRRAKSAPAPKAGAAAIEKKKKSLVGPLLFALTLLSAGAIGAVIALAANNHPPAAPPAPSTLREQSITSTRIDVEIPPPPPIVAPEGGALTPPPARVPSVTLRPRRAPVDPAASASTLTPAPTPVRSRDPLADPD